MMSAVILAAGLSQRMGRPKLLLPLGPKTMIEHTVDAVLASEVEEVIVVIGAHGAKIREVLGRRGVIFVNNPDYASGQASSVAAGTAVVHPRAKGIIYVNGDQPLMSPIIINRLLKVFNRSQALIVRTAANTPPTIFDISLRSALERLSGDSGGRQLFEKYEDKMLVLSESGNGAIRDVDTQEDYKELSEIFKTRCEATSN